MNAVWIAGDARTKGSVELRLDGEASRGDAAGVRWALAELPGGPWTALDGVHTRNIALPVSLGGRYLRAEVVSAAGDVLVSEPVHVERGAGNPNVDWLHEARFGISHHFISNYVNRVAAADDERWRDDESWDDLLATFDVDAYVADVIGTGARFVILTLGQNTAYQLAPNETYERLAGLSRGVVTPSRRDLPMEIADALAPEGVRLMMYLPANPPFEAHREPGDFAVTDAFGQARRGDGAPTQETMGAWQAVIRDYSERYGDNLAGWWFDGVYPEMWPSYDDMAKPYNWASMTAAAKAGNPSRIVAYNPGMGIATTGELARWVDYAAGELNEIGSVPRDGRWADEDQSVQQFAFTYLGTHDPHWAGWGNAGTSKQTGELVDWVQAVTDGGGVVCLDAKLNRFGRIDRDQLAQLERVRDVV